MEYVRELAQLGRSLAPTESIELSSLDEPRPAVVNEENRKRLQRIANLREIDIERVVTGQVTGLRDNPPQFDLTFPDGARLTGSYLDPDRFDDLQPFLGRQDRAPMVALSVVATSSLQGRLQRITDVLSVEAALPPEWASRIDELARLRSGWLSPDTPVVAAETISAVEQFLLACVDERIPRPQIYPTSEASILLEWAVEATDLELEFGPDRAVFRWVSMRDDREATSDSSSTDVDSLIDSLEHYRGLG